MDTLSLVLVGALLLVQVAVLGLFWRQRHGHANGPRSGEELRRLEAGLAQALAQARAEAARESRELREEVGRQIHLGTEALRGSLDRRLGEAAQVEREGLKYLGDLLRYGLAELHKSQQTSFSGFRAELGDLGRATGDQLTHVRATLDLGMSRIQASNEQRLDEMRRIVDEKLHESLDKRLGESFRQVSERLEQVHRGLGEMQSLAIGVGDLKRLMTNVKARGTWGELQLGALLQEVLTPDQFAANVETRQGSGEYVEFAIRLPGRQEGDAVVWLPIDAKFPQEDYQRLLEAHEQGDADAALQARKGLERAFRLAAKTIADHYLYPPATTDFAILFVPIEGLFAELLRRPGLVDGVQREFRVAVAGPTTLGALLSSLRMGFRSLAIQQRSSEVWEILGAVKTEFEKFGGMLERAQKKVQEAGNVLDLAKSRSRAMERKLRAVEALPTARADALLELPGPLPDSADPPTPSSDE